MWKLTGPQIDEVTVKKDKSKEIDENGYVPVEIEIQFGKSVNSTLVAERIVKTNVKTILSTYEYVRLHIYEPPANQLEFETIQKNGQQIAIVKTKAISRYFGLYIANVGNIFFTLCRTVA